MFARRRNDAKGKARRGCAGWLGQPVPVRVSGGCKQVPSPLAAEILDSLEQRALGRGAAGAGVRGRSGSPSSARRAVRRTARSAISITRAGSELEVFDAIIATGLIADTAVKIVHFGIGVKAQENSGVGWAIRPLALRPERSTFMRWRLDAVSGAG